MGETPFSQPEAVHEVTPLGTPPTLTVAGVGRRTSVLFKKAKNGARIVKNKSTPLQNGKTTEEKTSGLDTTLVSPDSISENTTTLPPTPNTSPTPASPSSHRLRSRGPSSESEAGNPPAPPIEEGKSGWINALQAFHFLYISIWLQLNVFLLGLTNGKHTSADQEDDDDSNLT